MITATFFFFFFGWVENKPQESLQSGSQRNDKIHREGRQEAVLLTANKKRVNTIVCPESKAQPLENKDL